MGNRPIKESKYELVVAPPIWKNFCSANRAGFTIVYPFFDTAYMKDMLTTVDLIKILANVFHKLRNTDGALLSF